MSPNAPDTRRHLARRPSCETLEGRTLLSGLNIPSSLQAELISGIGHHAIKTVPAGVAAVTSALRGGPGSEFVALVRRQIANPTALLNQFTSGRTTAASTAGIAVTIPKIQDQFAGVHFDHLAATGAGAVLLPNHTLELGAILRGPNDTPVPAYYVFGLDRGAGATLGPAFPARPGLTPDALVTITVGPNNFGASGIIDDLKSGAVTTIDPSQIQVNDATLRVFVDPAQLPSTGLPIARYRFAFWTRSQLDGGIETVGSFLPDTSMIPIGVQRGPGRRG